MLFGLGFCRFWRFHRFFLRFRGRILSSFTNSCLFGLLCSFDRLQLLVWCNFHHGRRARIRSFGSLSAKFAACWLRGSRCMLFFNNLLGLLLNTVIWRLNCSSWLVDYRNVSSLTGQRWIFNTRWSCVVYLTLKLIIIVLLAVLLFFPLLYHVPITMLVVKTRFFALDYHRRVIIWSEIIIAEHFWLTDCQEQLLCGLIRLIRRWTGGHSRNLAEQVIPVIIVVL